MTARRGVPAKRHKKHVNHERWVISYADLLTLLLAFFVVLYASSTRDKQKIAAEAASFMKAFHAPSPVIIAPAGSRGVMLHEPSPIARPVPHPANRQLPVIPARSPSLPDAAAKAKAADIIAMQILSAALQNLLSPLIAKNQVSVVAQPL